MTHIRLTAALLAAGTAAALLTGCGSDSSSDSAAGGTGGGGGGSSISGPCKVTDQSTIASVFPGVGPGKAGNLRNCDYTLSGGGKVTIFLFPDESLSQYESSLKSNNIKYTEVKAGEGAVQDTTHNVTVKQGDVLFGVSAHPAYTEKDYLTKYDSQVLVLANKIAKNL